MPEQEYTGLRCLKFYENWWQLAETRDTDEKRLAFYDTIMRYAFHGVVPERPSKGKSHGRDWASWDAYQTVKPIIDGVLERECKAFAGKMSGLARRNNLSLLDEYEEGTENRTAQRTENRTDSRTDSRTDFGTENPSLIKEKDKEKDNDNEKEKEKENRKEKKNNGDSVSDDEKIMFESWWTSYPGFRKQDKRKCFEKFVRILKASKDEVSMFNAIMNGLERWKKCDTWTNDGGRYICAPLVWLNNDRWEAEISTRSFGKSTVSNIHHDPNAEVGNAF